MSDQKKRRLDPRQSLATNSHPVVQVRPREKEKGFSNSTLMLNEALHERKRMDSTRQKINERAETFREELVNLNTSKSPQKDFKKLPKKGIQESPEILPALHSTGTEHMCPICWKEFPYYSTLKLHLRQHNTNRRVELACDPRKEYNDVLGEKGSKDFLSKTELEFPPTLNSKNLLSLDGITSLCSTDSDCDSGVYSASCRQSLSPRSGICSPCSSTFSSGSGMYSPILRSTPSPSRARALRDYSSKSSHTLSVRDSHEKRKASGLIRKSTVQYSPNLHFAEYRKRVANRGFRGDRRRYKPIFHDVSRHWLDPLRKTSSRGRRERKFDAKDSWSRLRPYHTSASCAPFLSPASPSEEKWSFGMSSRPKRKAKNFQPQLLKLICQDAVSTHQLKGQDVFPEGLRCSAIFQKEHKTFIGYRAIGNGGFLQGPDSEVQLTVPKGLSAFIMGCVHTDPKPFQHAIPQDECLVAPIVDYHCCFKRAKPQGCWFKVKVPHCIRKKKSLNNVKVRHGNIYNAVPFKEIPNKDCHFDIDEHFITIFTRHFSQFVCTSCEATCRGEGKAFIFGKMSPMAFPPLTSNLRLYICSPLHRIHDYRQKLIEVERIYKRQPLDEMDIFWNPQSASKAQVVRVSVYPQRWNPKQPIKAGHIWDPMERKLFQDKEVCELSDMFHCHNCKMEPSMVANFSFICPVDGRPGGEVRFSGSLSLTFIDGPLVMDTDFDLYPTEPGMVGSKQSNIDHLHLLSVTKTAISSDDDLYPFGLYLGYTFSQIQQKRTNHPHSIENAALDIAIEWWDSCTKEYQEKVKILEGVMKEIGKADLVDVRQIMHLVDVFPDHNVSTSDTGTDRNDTRVHHRASRVARESCNQTNGVYPQHLNNQTEVKIVAFSCGGDAVSRGQTSARGDGGKPKERPVVLGNKRKYDEHNRV